MPITLTTDGVEPPLIDVTLTLYVTPDELRRLGEWLKYEGFDGYVDISDHLGATP